MPFINPTNQHLYIIDNMMFEQNPFYVRRKKDFILVPNCTYIKNHRADYAQHMMIGWLTVIQNLQKHKKVVKPYFYKCFRFWSASQRYWQQKDGFFMRTK